MAEAQRERAAAAACMLTLAGGSLDAWAYIGHGQVFANAQTGDVVLAAMAAASGNEPEALRHIPVIAAFCLGIVASRLSGAWLKRRGLNSRTVRLLAEAAALAVLAAGSGTLGDGVATAVVGFLAAVQITALSHMHGWSFNTGMTTGNLRSALSAASAAWLDPGDSGKRRQALVLGLMCCAFAIGALTGAAATLRWGNPALFGTAVLVMLAAMVAANVPDPMP